MDALRLDIDGTLTELTFGPAGTLRTLQEGVGGIVDCVSLAGSLDMWVHDEGLFVHEANPFATDVAHLIDGRRFQNFHGPVVFTGGPDDGGDTRPLSKQEAERIEAYVVQLAGH